jgi:hypothetical protein
MVCLTNIPTIARPVPQCLYNATRNRPITKQNYLYSLGYLLADENRQQPEQMYQQALDGYTKVIRLHNLKFNVSALDQE